MKFVSVLYYSQYQDNTFDWVSPLFQKGKYMYTVCNKLSSLVLCLLTDWRYY